MHTYNKSKFGYYRNGKLRVVQYSMLNLHENKVLGGVERVRHVGGKNEEVFSFDIVPTVKKKQQNLLGGEQEGKREGNEKRRKKREKRNYRKNKVQSKFPLSASIHPILQYLPCLITFFHQKNK